MQVVHLLSYLFLWEKASIIKFYFGVEVLAANNSSLINKLTIFYFL